MSPLILTQTSPAHGDSNLRATIARIIIEGLALNVATSAFSFSHLAARKSNETLKKNRDFRCRRIGVGELSSGHRRQKSI